MSEGPGSGSSGIMQDLYDDMIPGIARRQEGTPPNSPPAWPRSAEFIPGKVVKYREDAERVMREFEDSDLDGVLVVMLTYGPAMRVARLLAESRLPICLANIQPEPDGHRRVGHGRHDLQPGRARGAGHRQRHGRAGQRFAVLTDDWQQRDVPAPTWAAGRGPRRR